MSYQVIARKWRPQKFEDVIGQPAVTRTLANALKSGRLAQAFVFAGPRGVGKTTTARILARALNCVNGPTAEPCGKCDACVEIRDGRDMDVVEIDAATHTQVDNIREVIISGLSIAPVRNRYKVFIIDEVHQLSSHSFNALLKSIEEPPPHVIFMMATTELDRIPETVLSRSQVFELRTISTKAIALQLRRIVDQEEIAVGDESLQLIARDAEGSMRDAQSKLDQVLAFTGRTITAEDVATVLGLVGRDLLFDAVQAVADENAAASFELAGRAVEMGYDLRAVCRELSRVVRDLLMLTVDPSRISDAEIAAEGERDRLKSLAARFSREDLLRAFDLLTRAESEIRGAAQPRYHLEMALLRWIHLRKLAPIEDLIARVESGSGGTSQQKSVSPQPASSGTSQQKLSAPQSGSSRIPRTEDVASGSSGTSQQKLSAPQSGLSRIPRTEDVASGSSGTSQQKLSAPQSGSSRIPRTEDVASGSGGTTQKLSAPQSGLSRIPRTEDVASGLSRTGADFKDALLAEIKKTKSVLYNMVVAQAQKIEVSGDRVTFTFSPAQRTLASNLDQHRAWLEGVAQQIAGRRVTVVGVQGEAGPPAPLETSSAAAAPATVPGPSGAAAATGARGSLSPAAPAANGDSNKKSALREQALADAGVQALLDVFPAEIRDVEEM